MDIWQNHLGSRGKIMVMEHQNQSQLHPGPRADETPCKSQDRAEYVSLPSLYVDVLVMRPLWHSCVDGLEGEVVAVRGDLAVKDVQNLDVELLPAAVAARTDPVKEKKCNSI